MQYTPLGDRFENLLPRFPAYCKTVILPFKDIIIYDGFVEGMNVIIGPNMTRNMNADYKEAKSENKILSNL